MKIPTAPAWIDGGAAESPPSANGELLFAAPWEARAFGMAVSLCRAGYFTWDEFQAELIAAIARWEATAGEDDDYPYYRCWLQALEVLSERKGLAAAEPLAARVEALAARPHGHDHGHHHEGG